MTLYMKMALDVPKNEPKRMRKSVYEKIKDGRAAWALSVIALMCVALGITGSEASLLVAGIAFAGVASALSLRLLLIP